MTTCGNPFTNSEESHLLLVPRGHEHRWVADLDQIGSAKPVKSGAKTGAVSAQLTELDVTVPTGCAGHFGCPPICAKATGRTKKDKVARRPLRAVGFTQTDAPCREAEAEGTGITEAAIDPVIDV